MVWPPTTWTRSQPPAASARAAAIASSSASPPRAQSVAFRHAASGRPGRPRGPHRREHLEREAQPVLEIAAVLVLARVGQGREKLPEQVAMAHVQLEQVEAGARGAPRRRRRRRAQRPCRRGPSPAGLADPRPVGQRRRRKQRPAAARRGRSTPARARPGRAAPARVREPRAHQRLGDRVARPRRIAPPGLGLLVAPQPRVAAA